MTSEEYRKYIDDVFDLLSKWHNNKLTIFDFEENIEENSLLHTIAKLAYYDYLGWHYCEVYFENLRNKNFNGLLITESNKSRNLCMEQIDEYFHAIENSDGDFHSESFGSIMDRILNDYIKYLHCLEYEDNRAVDLKDQIDLLIDISINLLEDVKNGKKKLLVWKKFKVKYE